MSKQNKVLQEIRSWLIIVIFAFVIMSCLNSKVFATAEVRQSSMEDTLYSGHKLIVDKFTYNFSKPNSGDIIIFLENEERGNIIDETTRYWKSLVLNLTRKNGVDELYPRLVKRVIGVEGDTVDIRDGNVYINDILLEEDYAKGVTYEGVIQLPIIVDENHLFVLGDNRMVSSDSREFGLIPIEQVEGRVTFRFSPLEEFGKIK